VRSRWVIIYITVSCYLKNRSATRHYQHYAAKTSGSSRLFPITIRVLATPASSEILMRQTYSSSSIIDTFERMRVRQTRRRAKKNSHPRIYRMLAKLGEVWNLPGLEERVKVVYSSRLRRRFGSCTAAEYSIRLNPVLETRPKLEAETLCHEAAHVAVFEVFRGRCSPHGPEWKEFVMRAGFEPKVSLTARGMRTAADKELKSTLIVTDPSVSVYEHRCTVCQSIRMSPRPVTRWRCAACVKIGLEGRMLITRRPRKVISE